MLISLIAIGLTAAAGGDVPRSITQACRTAVRSGVAVDLVGTRFAPEQGADPSADVAAINARQSMLLLPHQTFVLRTSTIYPGRIEFRFRTVGGPEGERTIDELGWRDGDALVLDDKASSTKDYADLQLLVPALLMCGSSGRASKYSNSLEFKDAAQRSVTAKIDPTSQIVEAVVGNETYRYSGWHVINGIPSPTIVQRERAGQIIARWTNIKLRAARAADRAWAIIPAKYRAADPAGGLRATKLADGAYRVDGGATGYHTGFVAGDRDIAVFDAPVGTDAAKAVRALIEKTAPGREIRYVVVSHVHGDHVGGLLAYPDAEIITGRKGSVAIARQFPTFAPYRVREITDATSLDLGGRSIKLFPLKSLHSWTMVVGYDLESRAIFQGDLFYLPERGAVPAPFATAVELSRLVAAEGLKVDWIVGVHGRSATADDMRQALTIPLKKNADRGGVGNMVSYSTRARSRYVVRRAW